MDLPFVDAHVHFWDLAVLPYPWLAKEKALSGAHVPETLRAEAGDPMPHQIVFVQAECERSRALDEVAWVEELAHSEPRIAAIVAFAPVDEGDVTTRALDRLRVRPMVRGVRHLIQSASDPDFCRRPAFIDGVRAVGERGMSFDLCLRHHQLPAAIDLVRACPATRFVLDHIGKPDIAARRLDPWRGHIQELAALPNVVCKLSGLASEADPTSWTIDDLRPYADHVLHCFGADRLLFGSVWPVVKPAASYAKWLATASALLDHLGPNARRSVFFDNARRAYGFS